MKMVDIILFESQYPDVVSLASHILTSGTHESFIMDAEIVAVDADGNLKSFQELSNRARKDVSIDQVKVTVCVFAFDLMYLDKQARYHTPPTALKISQGHSLTG